MSAITYAMEAPHIYGIWAVEAPRNCVLLHTRSRLRVQRPHLGHCNSVLVIVREMGKSYKSGPHFFFIGGALSSNMSSTVRCDSIATKPKNRKTPSVVVDAGKEVTWRGGLLLGRVVLPPQFQHGGVSIRAHFLHESGTSIFKMFCAKQLPFREPLCRKVGGLLSPPYVLYHLCGTTCVMRGPRRRWGV